jgi:hypothetical protein
MSQLQIGAPRLASVAEQLLISLPAAQEVRLSLHHCPAFEPQPISHRESPFTDLVAALGQSAEDLGQRASPGFAVRGQLLQGGDVLLDLFPEAFYGIVGAFDRRPEGQFLGSREMVEKRSEIHAAEVGRELLNLMMQVADALLGFVSGQALATDQEGIDLTEVGTEGTEIPLRPITE